LGMPADPRHPTMLCTDGWLGTRFPTAARTCTAHGSQALSDLHEDGCQRLERSSTYQRTSTTSRPQLLTHRAGGRKSCHRHMPHAAPECMASTCQHDMAPCICGSRTSAGVHTPAHMGSVKHYPVALVGEQHEGQKTSAQNCSAHLLTCRVITITAAPAACMPATVSQFCTLALAAQTLAAGYCLVQRPTCTGLFLHGHQARYFRFPYLLADIFRRMQCVVIM
jgi:hypothetical protein